MLEPGAPRPRGLTRRPAQDDARARRALRQYAGNYKYNTLAGVEDEKGTGAIYGTDEKATVCLFPRGSVNEWNVRARRAGPGGPPCGPACAPGA
jgi:hypothetical protein